MPYDSLSELPEDVRDALPRKAQRIYLEAYNSADEDDNQSNPSAVAWSAVEEVYEKNEDGEWVKKNVGDYIIKSKDKELQYTLGVVYEPMEKDLEDDYTDAEEIRKAQWDYMKRLQEKSNVEKACIDIVKNIVDAVEDGEEIMMDITSLSKEYLEKSLGDMHQKTLDDDSYIVDNYRAPCNMEVNGKSVKKGAWLLGVKWSDEMWQKIKKGERTGFSMEGYAGKVEEKDKVE